MYIKANPGAGDWGALCPFRLKALVEEGPAFKVVSRTGSGEIE
jgi:hypothetical protein